MNLPPILENHKEDLVSLCQEFKVSKLYAFGSVVSERFNPLSSDLDFWVEMLELIPIERGEALLGLWDGLEDLFNRKVDLLTTSQIENPYLRKSIEASKVLVYDGSGKEILS